jgi:hypothetical protein
VASLIMLAGIYYGAQYGGAITSILLNTPGETASAVTCLDGYQMARQGRAGPALAIAALASFFAGCVCTLIIALAGPPLAEWALKFGPAEYFSLMLMALVSAAVLTHGDLVKGLAMVVLGLLAGLVGTDVNSGVARYTFDVLELTDGVGFTVIAVGLFAVAEIVGNLERKEPHAMFTGRITHLMPSRQDLGTAGRRCATALGAFFGCYLAPACAADVRGLHAREEAGARSVALRQGCDRGRGGARGGEQRGGADRLHPDAHARHPGNPDHGADGRGNDHAGPLAGAAGDGREAGAVLGDRRQHVDRQPVPGRPQPADDRVVGTAAGGALPVLFPRSCSAASATGVSNNPVDVYTSARSACSATSGQAGCAQPLVLGMLDR